MCIYDSPVIDVDIQIVCELNAALNQPSSQIRKNGLSKVEIYNLILPENEDVGLREIVDSFLYIASKAQLGGDDGALQVMSPANCKLVFVCATDGRSWSEKRRCVTWSTPWWSVQRYH